MPRFTLLPLSGFSFLLWTIWTPAISLAQSFSRLELGVQGASAAFYDPISSTTEKGGFGARASYNLSRILALDTEGDFFPATSLPGPQRGGRAFLAVAGPKAGWRWRKVGLFVKTRPGIVNFSNVLKITTGIQSDGIPFIAESAGGHRSHLTLDWGGVLEIYTTPRTMIRIDAGEMLTRYDDRTYRIPKTTGFGLAPGVIGNSIVISAGFSYRLGKIGEQSVSFTSARRWEVGAQYGLLSLGRAGVIGLPSLEPQYLGDDPGLGARLTYNFNRWLALDSALNYFYRDPHVGDAQRGGKILQACFGPKAGLRTQRAGFFLKVRPGFLRYGSVHDSFFPPFPTNSLTHFAVDFGGVLEFYPSGRSMLRLDLGHTLAFYGSQTVLVPKSTAFPNGNLVSGAFRDNGMQITAGFGWRF